MHDNHRHLKEIWLARPLRSALPAGLRPWLTDRGSLTERIVARSKTFEVKVLSHGPGRPMRDECALFGVRAGARVRGREVLLIADGQPVVYARSVLPRSSLRRGWQIFDHIGGHSLGQALFANPRIRRMPLATTSLDYRDTRYHRAVNSARLVPPPTRLWARRSLFRLRGRDLLVTEVFLPAILDLPA